MASGKTRVGRALAADLGWSFVDFDQMIESEQGRSVSDIFETHGEAHFRLLETQAAAKLLALDQVVLGSGGGWAARRGRLDELPPGTETFWLQVSTGEALRRASLEPGRRPLLDRPDAPEVAARLLEDRRPHYERADWAVDTDGATVEDVTARILEILSLKYPEMRTE